MGRTCPEVALVQRADKSDSSSNAEAAALAAAAVGLVESEAPEGGRAPQ